ncbi:MAG TPA: Crp/Fnr family transcriptional regulator [Patescibacteria group bacterium]|nr:Crp/Fnr family transcriptional regulator [Patescibacteria group bacterium]
MNNAVADRIKSFFSQFPVVRYKKGETILRANDLPHWVYYLSKGNVRFYSLNEEGRELTFNIFKPGTYFPIVWMIGNEPNIYFFEAVTPIELRRAPKEKVMEFIKADHEVLYELTQRLVRGLSGILVRMEYLMLTDAKRKITSTILMLAKRFGEKKKESILITLPITHQGIASLAGVTRETVSIEIKKLEKEGLIIKYGRLIAVTRIRKLKNESLMYLENDPLPYTF